MKLSDLKPFIVGTATLCGSIIGAGIFSLPYLTVKSGWLTMIFYFLILGALVIILHLFFGDLAIKTSDFKRLPGFAKIYLGKWGYFAGLFSMILGLFGTLLSYLILGSGFLAGILTPILGKNPLFYTILYFVLASILIFLGIKIIAKVEFLGLIFFFVVLVFIFLRGRFFSSQLNFSFPALRLENLFLPYGPVLFSLWGASLIPEAEEILKEKKYLLKKIIPSAILLAALIYLFFIFLILNITGSNINQIALFGLDNFLPRSLFSLLLFFGFLSTFNAFILLGLTLKKIFWYDLKIPKHLSWLIACFVPLILFFSGIRNFISIVSFVGGVMLAIDGILIALMYHKIKRKTQNAKLKTLMIYSLVLMLSAGIVYEIIYFIF